MTGADLWQHDVGNACLSITSGAGGTGKSARQASMLMRMYLRYCERKGWKAEMVDRTDGGKPASNRQPFT